MLEHIAILLVHALYLYARIGLLFAAIFVTFGVGRIDEQAAAGDFAF